MYFSMPAPLNETDPLIALAAHGDRDSWGALLAKHAHRLRRLVAFRMDQRLQGRIDPSDVIQEASLEAWQGLEDYSRDPRIPYFLWMRGVVEYKLGELHRHHLGTQMRDAA
jgi:RNA polymerase sigma-70 factor (ECF subfamily)